LLNFKLSIGYFAVECIIYLYLIATINTPQINVNLSDQKIWNWNKSYRRKITNCLKCFSVTFQSLKVPQI